MILDSKPLNDLTQGDLQTLVTDAVSEGKGIEYKSQLPKSDRASKIEFLKDVSCFANTGGGYLLFGITEQNGIATAIPGCKSSNLDDLKLWMENLIRDNLDPRLVSYTIESVPLKLGSIVLVLKIPRSYIGPHAVNYSNHWRFYARNSTGAYPLDVGETRQAFLRAQAVGEKIQKFRSHRIAAIESGGPPLDLGSGPKIALHLVPLEPVAADSVVDLRGQYATLCKLTSLLNYVNDHRWNMDGLVGYVKDDQGPYYKGYIQVFRTGIIESVHCDKNESKGERFFAPKDLETRIIRNVLTYIHAMRTLDLGVPYYLYLTLIGMKGIPTVGLKAAEFDRNIVDLLEIELATYTQSGRELAKMLRPLFDDIWSAGGGFESPNYNREGEYIEHFG